MSRPVSPKIPVRLSAVRDIKTLLIREDAASSSTGAGATTFTFEPPPADEGTVRRRALNRTVRSNAHPGAIGSSAPRCDSKGRFARFAAALPRDQQRRVYCRAAHDATALRRGILGGRASMTDRGSNRISLPPSLVLSWQLAKAHHLAVSWKSDPI